MASILHHPVAPTAPVADRDERNAQKSVPQQRQAADSFANATASPTRSRQ